MVCHVKKPLRRRKCKICKKMTYKWQGVQGGVAICSDGCYSTTGSDRRLLTEKEFLAVPHKLTKKEVGR